MSKTDEKKESPTATSRDNKSQEIVKSPTRPEIGLVPSQRGQSAPGGRGHLSRWRNELDRLFDQFSRNWLGMPAGRWESIGWTLDLREDDNNVLVRAEAPGFEAGDFDIQVRGDQLTLRATRQSEKSEKEGEFREWRQHDYYESVTLPTEVDANKVKAHYRHGILSLTLPKTEETRVHKINVEG